MQLLSVSTMMSKRPIWSVPVPACAMTTPFSSTACSGRVWLCPPMIRSTPQAGSSWRARWRSSSKPMWVSSTVKSMSMLLWALQILPTSAAAAAVSTKDPTRDSDLVWLMTSWVMMPMKRMQTILFKTGILHFHCEGYFFVIAIFRNSAYQNNIFAICSLRMLLVHQKRKLL